MDHPAVPDQFLTDAAQALHEACCGGYADDADPKLLELDALGHRHDALVVLDTVGARIHAASLRWAADRIRAECSVRVGTACCSRCAASAAQLYGWADDALDDWVDHPEFHPDPGPHEEARP